MGKRTRRKHSSHIGRKIAVTAVILIAIAGVLFGSYYYFTNKTNSQYINYINSFKPAIDKVNNSIVSSVSGLDQLDMSNQTELKKIESNISSASGSLQGILDKLNGTNGSKAYNPPAEYQSEYNEFLNGITANKQIFTQTLLILKNPQSSDTNNALNALKSDVTNASNSYTSSQLGKVSFSLPSGILTLPDKVSAFAKKAQQEYSAKLQLLQQYTDYFDKMDQINSHFQSAETDFNVSLNMVKSGQKNIDDLYLDIDNELSEINNIYNSYSALTVPPKLGTTHQKLNVIINSYTSYCNDFKTNLTQLEQAGNDQTQLAVVNQTFDNLETTYNQISNSFADYMKEYNNNRVLYSDISNL